MYKLIINDNFIVDITLFSESIDSNGILKLVINEPLSENIDLNEIELLLVGLKPYFEEDAIKSVKIKDENDEIILETYIFTAMLNASLSFNDKEHMTLDIILA